MIRVDKKLLSDLGNISKIYIVSIADLVERKIVESIKEFRNEITSEISRMGKDISYEISYKNKIL